jgi:hypothetical protein
MNKLYIWRNRHCTSDFAEETNLDFGDHSGGVVIVAENEKEARKILAERIEHHSAVRYDPYHEKHIEVDIQQKGLVIYAEGECD